jgi:hypothetical protein
MVLMIRRVTAMTARLVLGSLVSLLLAAGTASAEPDSGSHAPGVTPPAAAPSQDAQPRASGYDVDDSRWYGAGIMLTDALVVGASFVANSRDSAHLMIAAGGLWTLGGPVVHWAHGQRHNAALSLGLRVVLPVVGGYLGYRSAGPCHIDCHSTRALYETLGGVVIGMAVASLTDIVVVARTRRTRVDSTAWAPQLGVSGSQVTAGVAGWF